MKVSSTGTVARITRQFRITEDHPVVGMAYARPPKKVRIEWGSIEYILTRDGLWTPNSQFSIKIAGPVLKNDGTDSKNRHDRSPETFTYDSEDFTDEFAWLKPIVDLLRPSGEAATTDLTDTMVNP
jgi:hypothetical protein